MHHYYYLFGTDAIYYLNSETISEFIKRLKKDGIIGQIYHYDESNDSPDDLLSDFGGWGAFERITKPLYNYIYASTEDDESSLKDILTFLEKYATSVRDDEDSAYVELMMDNHICIEFDGKQYYIPTSNSSWTDDDSEIYDFLNDYLKL